MRIHGLHALPARLEFPYLPTRVQAFVSGDDVGQAGGGRQGGREGSLQYMGSTLNMSICLLLEGGSMA